MRLSNTVWQCPLSSTGCFYSSLLELLKAKANIWILLDEVRLLLDHEDILNTLLHCLRGVPKNVLQQLQSDLQPLTHIVWQNQNGIVISDDRIDKLLRLDKLCRATHVSVLLRDTQRRGAVMARRKETQAQTLLDLLQSVLDHHVLRNTTR